MEYSYELKIPKDRIAVLIGKKGDIKKNIESETNTKLEVDSKEGDVFITGDDAIGIFTAKDVITAIARGFNPDFALLLLKPDYSFVLFNITDYAGKHKNNVQRLKGRVIGTNGKSRGRIEDLTETHICVYGKTIGIIGEVQNVALARKAVESLLDGSPHSSVYKWLEKKRKSLKMAELGIPFKD